VPPDPLEEALAALERGRRERTAVIAVLVAALVATVVVIAAAVGGTDWSTATGVALVALLAVVGAHVTSLVVRERRSVRATRALVAARAERASHDARERSLAALQGATRRVGGTLELREVVDRAAEAAADLLGVDDAELLLRTGDELAVAAATGRDPAPRGRRRAVTDADRAVLEGGEAVASGRGSSWGDGAARITAPLALPGRTVGTLVVRGTHAGRPFTESDRLAVALLAEHVALALRNATAHDRERQRADAFRSLIGVAPDALDAPIARTERTPLELTVSISRDTGLVSPGRRRADGTREPDPGEDIQRGARGPVGDRPT
jgi:GAF domain-containing protein